MKNYELLMDYVLDQAQKILAIDSPTGFTDQVIDYLHDQYTRLGYHPEYTTKGGLLVDLGGGVSQDACFDLSHGNNDGLKYGKNTGSGLLIEAHADTLGCMVAEIKDNGRLRLTSLGGMEANNAETENCLVYTRDGRTYEGTLQLIDPSLHVNKNYRDTPRSFDTTELVLDEDVNSKEDVKKLGIMNGDIVAFEARTRITRSGYIKSRFLDDKLSTAILLGQAKYFKEANITPSRKIYHHISVYEEVGHGAAGTVPQGCSEVLSVDMGCVGIGLECTERQVSICAKDSRGPYNYQMTSKLIKLAQKLQLDFSVDVYPFYGSDADVVLTSGHDLKHGLIGPGVFASHGYERSHVDGVMNTMKLLIAYTE